MRKVFTSLILLLLVQAIAPAAARANSIVSRPSNSNGATKHSHEQHRDRHAVLESVPDAVHGATFLFVVPWNGGSWTYSTGNYVLSGIGPANWNSTFYLTLESLPSTKGPFFIDLFQYSNGTLLSGEARN